MKRTQCDFGYMERKASKECKGEIFQHGTFHLCHFHKGVLNGMVKSTRAAEQAKIAKAKKKVQQFIWQQRTLDMTAIRDGKIIKLHRIHA